MATHWGANLCDLTQIWPVSRYSANSDLTFHGRCVFTSLVLSDLWGSCSRIRAPLAPVTAKVTKIRFKRIDSYFMAQWVGCTPYRCSEACAQVWSVVWGLVDGLQRIKQTVLWATVEARWSCNFQLWNLGLVKFFHLLNEVPLGNTCALPTWTEAGIFSWILAELCHVFLFFFLNSQVTSLSLSHPFPTLKPRRIPFQTVKLPLEHQEMGGFLCYCLFHCYFAHLFRRLLCRYVGRKVESK